MKEELTEEIIIMLDKVSLEDLKKIFVIVREYSND